MKSILVVDDLQSEVELISSYLSQQGYAVYTAQDGKQALEVIAKNKPDAVISDMMMPDMGGLELCRALKKDPSTADIPVIACTAKKRDIDRRWAAKQGVDSYLTKPYTRDQIVEAVRSVLEPVK